MTVSLRLSVRSYEIDVLGHAVYHQWGELGRVELFRAATLSADIHCTLGCST